MDLFSIWHWLVVGLVLLLLFGGRGKVSEVMGDVAKGIRSFKTGLVDKPDSATKPETTLNTADYHASAGYQQRSEPESKV